MSARHRPSCSPTRELATKIQCVVLAFGNYTSVQCRPGRGYPQARVQPARRVGHPGRVFDMIRRRILRTRSVGQGR
ncbi:hypothetical protein C8F01DRAFT_274582 [Mycena amicta]|nr:hypothetical protein C8F01DRAFT_274582 [Mycena amicta]